MGRLRERQVLQNLLQAFFFWFCIGSEMLIQNVVCISSESSYFLYEQPQYPRDCEEVMAKCSSTHNTSGVYIIKPDGYPEAFEVYCDNYIESGGWTVLHRRSNGFVNFNRNWDHYREGFGFLGSEFWLGNDKIAFLSNQKQYQLRLDVHNKAGMSYYVTYDNFRISDEWGEYSLSSLTHFRGTAGQFIEWCPTNQVFSNQTCERTCDDPETCITEPSSVQEEQCVCIGDYRKHEGNCISKERCGCYSSEKGDVLQNGESYVNSDCTSRSNCSNNQLHVEENYACGDEATCDERNGVRRCYCNDGYDGDGVTCTRIFTPKDCHELFVNGTDTDGVYTIYPDGYPNGIQIKCEMEANVGGWTIFQQHSDASVDFYRDWSDYEDGFGNPSNDHWLGNKYIHAITNQKTYQLRIDMRDSTATSKYALYSSFSISSSADKYRLSIGSYSGTTGADALITSNNRRFSTRDQDNDEWDLYHCAQRHRGAWWFGVDYRCLSHYSSSDCRSYCPGYSYYCEAFPDGNDNCAHCAGTHLNAEYNGVTRGTNMFWEVYGTSNDCNMRYATMKIKPA